MSQMLRAFQFAKKSLLELRPGLEEVSEDAAAAEEWIQNFSIFLESVFSSRAGVDLAAEEDTEVSNFLEEVRARLLRHASAAWVNHSPRVVAGHEERLLNCHSYTTLNKPSPSDGPSTSVAQPGLSLVTPSPFPPSAGNSLEPSPSGSPGLGLTNLFSHVMPNSPTLLSAAVAASPSDVFPLPYSLSAGTPPLKQAGVKRGRPLELIDVRTLDDYVRCEPCISSKTKCAPLVGTGPPYPCARCVKTGRECVRDPATRSRHNGSAMPALGLPPALEELSTGAFFGMGEELSGVALASVVTHWRGELVRSLAASAALTEHIKFVHYQYSLALTPIAGPPAASGGPPAKRARSSSSKEKVVDVDAPMKTRASSRGKVKVDAGARMETRASSKSKEKARMDVEDGTVTEAEDGAEAENWEGFTGDDL
ncbi:hypothetical protein EDB85DRAFT_2153951 [Lactarius pseudohatsudake]|nr:hypothetical protein EDB85DRAFT_2153951 [Lactarius pseudohatsudake]